MLEVMAKRLQRSVSFFDPGFNQPNAFFLPKIDRVLSVCVFYNFFATIQQ